MTTGALSLDSVTLMLRSVSRPSRAQRPRREPQRRLRLGAGQGVGVLYVADAFAVMAKLNALMADKSKA